MAARLKMFEESGAGLNRISITSPVFFAKKDCNRLCNALYGFQDYGILQCLIDTFFDVQYEKPSQVLIDPKIPLSDYEQILLIYLWMNVTWNNDIVGLMFGIRCRKQLRPTSIDGYL
mmetsp:Transcript_27120/g.33498  ORF Transcript_27120/g.33498 Transcript_27120/m.33498 type:complete len:117 (+) Transcript_27120:890-1240(+)